MKLLKYQFKRSFKKPVTILIIAVIFFIGINLFNEMKYLNGKIKHNKEISYSYSITTTSKNIHEINKQLCLDEGNIEKFNFLNITYNYGEIAMDNYNKGNYKEAYKNEIILAMIEARLACSSMEEVKFLRDNIIEIWNELLPDMDYDNLNILSEGYSYPISVFRELIINIKYKYEIYSKNVRYVYETSLNNLTFTYNMIERYLPFIIILVISLITFNCISDEYKSGVVKNIATQGIKRSRYYFTMIFANFIVAIIIITSAMIALNLMVGFSSDFQSFDTPILSHENHWNSITTKSMDLDKSYLKYGTRLYLGPTEVNYDDLSINLFDDYKFITFKTFLAEVICVYLLFGFFLTALSVFISSIFADKIKALIALVLIIGVGYFTAYMSPSILNVFSTLKVTQIITGSSSLTLLGIFITLGISTVITLVVGITYFKRKDITY